MNKEQFGSKITRQAIGFKLGGFKPSEKTDASWFGKVLLCKEGEEWPISNGKPMIAICQINVEALLNRPAVLKDVAFMCLFIDSEELPDDAKNGDGWLLRTYERLEDLVPIKPIETETWIKPFQLQAEAIEKDYPHFEDCPYEIPEAFSDEYYDLFPNQKCIKIGGWPSLVQSEIYWEPFNEHEAKPKYVFQIPSIMKANWSWGDDGVAYIGRGTLEGFEKEWTFSWQCY